MISNPLIGVEEVNGVIDLCHELVHNTTSEVPNFTPVKSNWDNKAVRLVLSIPHGRNESPRMRELIKWLGGEFDPETKWWIVDFVPTPNNTVALTKMYDFFSVRNYIVAAFPIHGAYKISEANIIGIANPIAIINAPYANNSFARDIGAKFNPAIRRWTIGWSHLDSAKDSEIDARNYFGGFLTENGTRIPVIQQNIMNNGFLSGIPTTGVKSYQMVRDTTDLMKTMMEINIYGANAEERAAGVYVAVICHYAIMPNSGMCLKSGYQCQIEQAREIWSRLGTYGYMPMNGSNFQGHAMLAATQQVLL